MDKGSDLSEFVLSFKNKVRYLILLETANIIENLARGQGINNIKK